MIFELTEEQSKQASEWINKQRKDNKYEGAIGGRFSFMFTNTSLGQSQVVRDNITGEDLNLTNYDHW